MEAKGSFTGRARQRTTRRSVLIADRLARIFISVGGIGTIIAVLGVMVFLVWVVVPLFLPAKVEGVDAFDRASREELLHLGVDEYQVLSWVLLENGKAEVFRLDTGELRYEEQLFDEGQLTAASFLTRGDLSRRRQCPVGGDRLRCEDFRRGRVAATGPASTRRRS